jgi:ATP-binding cassette subfamily F protein 3
VLALIVSRRPNLLLLDEPTNHLDLEMRHALGMALQDYPGAIVLVSHDRYLLRLVADELWLVAGGRAGPFDGDLDDYAQWLRSDAQASEDPAADRGGASRGAMVQKERKRLEAERRQRLTPLRSAVTRAEADIAKLTAELAGLEEQLHAPTLYEPAARKQLTELLATQADRKRRLDAAEEAWLIASEALEQATQAS